jgi:hypothetical protein
MSLFGKEKITLTLEKYDYKPGDKQKQENWKYHL